MIRQCDTIQWPFQEHHAMQGTERAEGEKELGWKHGQMDRNLLRKDSHVVY